MYYRNTCDSCKDNTERIVIAKHLYDKVFRYPVMDKGADTDSNQYIGKYLLCSFSHLLPRKFHTVFEMQFLLRYFKGMTVSDIFLHLIFKVKLLDNCAAKNGNNKTEYDVEYSNFPTENAHQQHKAAEIDHRGRNKERKCYTERKSRTCKADK